jgi:hypothetical protein
VTGFLANSPKEKRKMKEESLFMGGPKEKTKMKEESLCGSLYG